ncbi:MAG: VanZ family protein [Micrococcales bacterium]
MPELETLAAYLGRLIDLETLGMLMVWGALGFLLRRPLGRISKLKGWKLFWTAGTTIVILAFTLRLFNLDGSDPVPWPLNWLGWSQSLTIGANWFLNLLLFVPAAFVLVLVGKKPSWVFVGLVLLSAFIETIQQLTWSGVADPADFVANSFGAAFGILLGLLWRRASKK